MSESKNADVHVIQKLHCKKSMIPKQEEMDHIVISSQAQILKMPLRNIPHIHPYCLDISASIALYIPEKKQLAFTDEQIVYIPDMALSAFSETFFDESFQKSQKELDKVYKVDIINRMSNNTYAKDTIEEKLYDKLLRCYVRKQTSAEAIKRKKEVREKKDEAEWQTENSIPTRAVADILDMSEASVRRIFSDSVTKTPKKMGMTAPMYYTEYSAVIDYLNEHVTIGTHVDKKILEEHKKYCKENDPEKGLEVLPLLYQNKDVFASIGFIFKKIQATTVKKIKGICDDKGIVFYFPELKNKGYRYLASDIYMVRDEEEIKQQRDKIFSKYGAEFDADKHKLQY